VKISFIGGGNMAAALIGALLRAGAAGASIRVVEIDEARCAWLREAFAVAAHPTFDASLAAAEVFVLAVKPQQMRAACQALRPFVRDQLVVSIAAGIRAVDLARWLGTENVVRTMPNTPALIGKGITGMAALAGVSAAHRRAAEDILRGAGTIVWVNGDAQLDAVTALSGSGPAYVFYFIEALIDAGREMGLDAQQARELAIATFVGAAQLAAQSEDPVELLRERVTSKGGTTAAALASMEADRIKAAIVRALHAANRRAQTLGEELGRD
jgi:pyrroline-5-carboxylate reductase